MKEGGIGGESTGTGLIFERQVDLLSMFARMPNYEIKRPSFKAGSEIYCSGALVARCFKKSEFYKFLGEEKIDWEKIISKKLLPDDALLIIIRKTLYIIEVKYQQVAGSVDEKLQTCDFKRKQYQKLLRSLELKVEYVYVLNDWYKKPQYKDVLEYIDSVNCHYTFGKLPLAWLGLPEE